MAEPYTDEEIEKVKTYTWYDSVPKRLLATIDARDAEIQKLKGNAVFLRASVAIAKDAYDAAGVALGTAEELRNHGCVHALADYHTTMMQEYAAEIAALKQERDEALAAKEKAEEEAEGWKDEALDWRCQHQRVAEDRCPGDEKHCACVPHLRALLKDRASDVEYLQSKCDKAESRAAALEERLREAERLLEEVTRRLNSILEHDKPYAYAPGSRKAVKDAHTFLASPAGEPPAAPLPNSHMLTEKEAEAVQRAEKAEEDLRGTLVQLAEADTGRVHAESRASALEERLREADRIIGCASHGRWEYEAIRKYVLSSPAGEPPAESVHMHKPCPENVKPLPQSAAEVCKRLDAMRQPKMNPEGTRGLRGGGVSNVDGLLNALDNAMTTKKEAEPPAAPRWTAERIEELRQAATKAGLLPSPKWNELCSILEDATEPPATPPWTEEQIRETINSVLEVRRGWSLYGAEAISDDVCADLPGRISETNTNTNSGEHTNGNQSQR